MTAPNISTDGSRLPHQPRFSESNMDRSVDPRKDFYRYSAGKWMDNNPIPSDKSEWGSFNELVEWNRSVLLSIVEDCSSESTGTNNFNKKLVGSFYKSAMDEKTINELRFSPIDDIWNLISGIKSTEALVELIPILHLEGVSVFFDVSSDVDAKNSTLYTLYLSQGGITMPERDYYLLDSFAEIRAKYLEHVARMFILKGTDEDTAKRWAKSILNLETKLAKISRSAAALRDVEKNYNRIDFDALASRFGKLKLVKYISVLGVRGVSYVIVRQPEFFDYLESMFSEADVEEMRVYLYWHLLAGYAPFLHDEIYSESFDFFGRKLRGQEQPELRWKRVLRQIDAQIGEALGQMYVERQFDEIAHSKSLDLVNDLISVFRAKLKKADWMTENTIARAIEKLDAIRVKIGYPDKFRDYSELRIESSDYLGNVRRSEKFEIKRQVTRVGKAVDRSEWEMTPSTVNAYYSPERNEIVFPAGILQPPFFDSSMDDAVNYGAIGAVIGHEITHGFDDEGRHFDSMGNILEWWTEEDALKFNEKAEKVKKFYGSQEPLPGIFINGELTLGENIADLGGVSIAYEALQLHYKTRPERKVTVDGLTPDQRFFIAYAQVWKSNIKEETLRMGLTMDPHSPERYRAIIPVKNHPAFDAVFPPGVAREDVITERIGVW